MPSSVALVVLAQLGFALLLGTVGVRLLLLAARTRCAPELALGIGFLGMIVAIPLLGLSGFGRSPVGELRYPMLAISLFTLWIAMSAMACFTWRAFRPEASWATVLAGGVSLLSAGTVVGLWHAVTGSEPSAPSLAASYPWPLWLRLPFALSLAWTGIEAFRQYGMARRRLALGIGNAVIVNRFLLWGWVSVFSFLNNGVGVLLQAQGRGPTNDPIGALVLAVGGIVGGTLVYLAFLPPQAWLRFVRARAAAA